MNDRQKLIDRIRSGIRDRGFMTSMDIVASFTRRCVDCVQPIDVLDEIESGDIKKIEYTNTMSARIPRIKELFYFNPE